MTSFRRSHQALQNGTLQVGQLIRSIVGSPRTARELTEKWGESRKFVKTVGIKAIRPAIGDLLSVGSGVGFLQSLQQHGIFKGAAGALAEVILDFLQSIRKFIAANFGVGKFGDQVEAAVAGLLIGYRLRYRCQQLLHLCEGQCCHGKPFYEIVTRISSAMTPCDSNPSRSLTWASRTSS